MKHIFTILLSALFLSSNASPRVAFDKMWVDYDITKDNARGMMLHLKFTTYELKGQRLFLVVVFEDENGKRLRDKNQLYSNVNGDVITSTYITPVYESSAFDDLTLFMPYSELEQEPGTYNLTMRVKIQNDNASFVQQLTTYPFEYEKPGGTSQKNAGPSGKFQDIQVVYDVVNNGEKGMNVIVSFSAMNMKDINGYLAIYFSKKDGEIIYSNNKSYRSTTGQLALYYNIKPGYDESVYKDVKLFIPYSEILLPAGRHNLKMSIDLIYEKGGNISHLKDYEFLYMQ